MKHKMAGNGTTDTTQNQFEQALELAKKSIQWKNAAEKATDAKTAANLFESACNALKASFEITTGLVLAAQITREQLAQILEIIKPTGK